MVARMQVPILLVIEPPYPIANLNSKKVTNDNSCPPHLIIHIRSSMNLAKSLMGIFLELHFNMTQIRHVEFKFKKHSNTCNLKSLKLVQVIIVC